MKKLKKFSTIILGSILILIGSVMKLEGSENYTLFLAIGALLTILFFILLFSGKIQIGSTKKD